MSESLDDIKTPNAPASEASSASEAVVPGDGAGQNAVTPLDPAAAEPPRARRSPTRHETHGVVRLDDYYWLRERESTEVIDYLHAENAHTDAVMAQTEALQETLFEEIKGRIKQTDMSVPYREGDFTYYRRYESCSTSTNSPRGVTSARSLAARSVRTSSCLPTRPTSRDDAFTRSASRTW